MISVPVIAHDGVPLMPTTPARARRMIKRREATPFFKKGIFCIRLNREPSGRILQPVAVGIDPGSKKEAYTVKSESRTYLNIQADAVTHVKKRIKTRREMRRGRRFRKTPCRKPRWNRASLRKKRIPPSTKARWQWKLRICRVLASVFPISVFVVEDIAAVTKKGKRGWNRSFSPLEVGKKWFYEELGRITAVKTRKGYQTKELRDQYGLHKSKDKMSEKFDAHCVDSWVLANDEVGGHIAPDDRSMMLIAPFSGMLRRQLHKLKCAKGGLRRRQGGTRSMDLKRGSLAKHREMGFVLIGGSSRGRISIHDTERNKRIILSAKREDLKFLAYNHWKIRRHSLAHEGETGR